MSIEDTLKQLARVSKQLQEARKEQIEAMSEHLKEAEKKLKEAREAREVSEVKLSDLPEEEWEACKGMWVRGKQPDGKAFDGIIIAFGEEKTRVHIPNKGYYCWRSPDQLILLPDYQRAFTSTGDPIKVDPGQWEKTRAMEDEFDRVKAEEDFTNSRVYKAITLAADKAGLLLVEAKITGAGDVTLNFEEKESK